MKLLNFSLIKLTICLIAGIVLAHYAKPDYKLPLYLTLGLVILIGIYWVFLKSKIDRLPLFGILSCLSMMGIGMISYTTQNEKIQVNHYTNLNSLENFNTITFKIKERLKPDNYNYKYIVSTSSINGKTASGKLLINIRKDSLNTALSVDDILFTSAQVQKIQKPLNPHQFDYSAYLELKQVYNQLYLESDELMTVSNSKTTIYGFADQLRTTINSKLIEAGFKDEALSIMNALLLGQRQTIDKTTYTNYVNSGTIHILAISGLHVGILLWILNFIFKPLLYLKYGNYIRPIVLITILWSFAIIAGLSPSVTRAVTMFSIISIAMHLKRPTNIYNTLVISAFFILLVKPTFLFEVGFQMSYLAVLGIVSVQPILYKLWKPRYLVTDKLWQVFTVTLAAQAGVVPISLFYFHQFPGLFFISNIVVIPFLGLILGFGLLVIALALMNMLHDFIVIAYSFIIDSLNAFIAWVAQFEDFLFRDIPFTILQVICSYLIIVALIQVYKFRNFKWIAFSLIAIISFQSISFYNRYKVQDDAFVVFNKSRYSMIGQKNKDQFMVHHNLGTSKQKGDNVIKNFKVGETIDSVRTDSLQSIYQFKKKSILVIDSLGVYKGLSFKPNYIILRNSPKLNLNRMIDSLQPELIIADASNYKSYVKRWKATCTHKKIPFHQTNEKGAYIIN
ncbi:ComEC/Rec2 family competence protein [Winogradskyella sp. UBA3174]|uniref:ComEC/Rec2 family competence protein n=1 Tax=Winogradskyella sp. UBA3174 TaxID=1947785 RepID=UPI0025F9F0B9|nr:ComEC/Rec2 family competence protein [Winogradskyella sp. UBA3174]|tara:strand:- start:6034 stop:8064 length:2031 start_codon:yes stop_codon:yes gene_type:complete